MKRTAILLLLLTAACASAPPPRGEPMMAMRGADNELLPPSNWWHDPYLQEPVGVTGEQMQSLDALQRAEGDDIDRMERDLRVAMRDLRSTLDVRDAVAADIIATGNRVAELRDMLFRRRITMLAHMRAILSSAQWSKLQDELASERRPRGMRDREGRGPGGGFGGPRRGGRRPPG